MNTMLINPSIIKLLSFGLFLNFSFHLTTVNAKEQPNLVFILTDQQRFDAIQYVQNELPQYQGKLKVRTPNIDRLFKEGAYFRNAYCQSPVCAPARGALRTGCTIERSGLQANSSIKKDVYEISSLFSNKVKNTVTLDQILAKEFNYQVEYYGKFHLPDFHYFQSDSTTPAIRYNDYNYANGSFLLRNGEDWAVKLKRYLKYDESKGNIQKVFKNGDQKDTYSKYPYTPIQLDARYGLPTDTSFDDTNTYPQLVGRRSQPNLKGPYSLGKGYTAIRYNGEIAVKALDRLAQRKDPFSLTVSFHNPHAPMLPAPEYLEYYWQNRDNIFVTPNLDDTMWNSAYSNKKYVNMGYTDKEKLQEWIACYYAMIEEIDSYVGQMLDKLEAHGIKDNTMVVFTSDHGEMLGSHGMREKNVFYEESVRIPLAISFPSIIQPGTVVNEGVSHLDLYSTILDYLGIGSSDESDGTSIRRFVENTSFNEDYDERVVVAEWDFRAPVKSNRLDRTLGTETNFMVLKGNYKLMMTKLAEASRLDMLYNLEWDPYEVNNLVGKNGLIASNQVIGKAEHLKCLLVEWMTRMDGPGYYSKSWFSDSLIGPYSDGITSSDGDIAEISRRRKWKKLDFWVSDFVLQFGKAVYDGANFKRNEYLYFGRTTDGILNVDKIEIQGSEKNLFSIEIPAKRIFSGVCTRLKVSFISSSLPETVDATIKITHSGGSEMELITIRMEEQASQNGPLIVAESPTPPSNTPGSINIPLITPTSTGTSSNTEELFDSELSSFFMVLLTLSVSYCDL